MLSQKVINYLVKSFTYCIAQNKGDATNMKSAIKALCLMHLVTILVVERHGVDTRKTLLIIVTEIFPMVKTSKEIAFNQP